MQEGLDLQTTYAAILTAARGHHYVTYGDLAKANGVEWRKARYPLIDQLGALAEVAANRGWPMLSSIVVNEAGRDSGMLDATAREGFIAAARSYGFPVEDPEAFVQEQRQKVFEWAAEAPADLGLPAPQASEGPETRGPRFLRFLGPVLDALRALGGVADPASTMDKVVDLAGVTDEELSETTKGGRSRYKNEVRWARFYLCRAGLIDDKESGSWALTAEGRETILDHEASVALYGDVRSRMNDGWAEEDDPAPDSGDEVSSHLFDDPSRSFWFVGATWGNEDQTERFLQGGIWTNGYDDKYGDRVQRIKSGDRIAIKSVFTRKNRVPFENCGKAVSCMRIKATGTVTGPAKDGRTVPVEWDAPREAKDWYFYTYWKTIEEANVADALARRLIRFAFGNHRQDYDFWLGIPYWAKKYGPSKSTATDLDDEEELGDAGPGSLPVEDYGVPEILDEGCFLSGEDICGLLDRLDAKRNLILQGPPGTGKTWLAKRLGYAVIGTRERRIAGDRMRVIQFHPSMSYEDFVRGWRPDRDGKLKLIDGVLLEAVGAARAEPDLPLVVIVEEINRGNPAQTFGEMLTLLERDKRREDEAIELAYQRETGERVFIPENLYVIGTMNVADRSLALVDFAFRRRFAFATLGTTLNERWERWCQEEGGLEPAMIADIRRAITELNEEIEHDSSLGPQFRIGHSFVTPGKGEWIEDPREWFRQVVSTEIAPLLEEYWYDNPDQTSAAISGLLGKV